MLATIKSQESGELEFDVFANEPGAAVRSDDDLSRHSSLGGAGGRSGLVREERRGTNMLVRIMCWLLRPLASRINPADPASSFATRGIWAARVLTQPELLRAWLRPPIWPAVFIGAEGDVFEGRTEVPPRGLMPIRRQGRVRFYEVDHVAFAEVVEADESSEVH